MAQVDDEWQMADGGQSVVAASTKKKDNTILKDMLRK